MLHHMPAQAMDQVMKWQCYAASLIAGKAIQGAGMRKLRGKLLYQVGVHECCSRSGQAQYVLDDRNQPYLA